MGQLNNMEMEYVFSTPDRLFVLFLFVVICVILMRMTRLSWRLWSIRRKQEFSSYGANDCEEINKAVLKGVVKREPKLFLSETISKANYIETRFLYLWETCYAKVQSGKTLAGITLILSFSVAALGFINICNGFMTEETAGITPAAFPAREVFALLASGLLVSALIFALSHLVEATLTRRRRDWNYLRARLKEESYSKQ